MPVHTHAQSKKAEDAEANLQLLDQQSGANTMILDTSDNDVLDSPPSAIEEYSTWVLEDNTCGCSYWSLTTKLKGFLFQH
jgi:translation elongation factor P/translation initiation factor 5A